MSKKQSVIKENNSQATDQQELLVPENNYKVSSVINFHIDHIVEELKDLTSHFFNLGYHYNILVKNLTIQSVLHL